MYGKHLTIEFPYVKHLNHNDNNGIINDLMLQYPSNCCHCITLHLLTSFIFHFIVQTQKQGLNIKLNGKATRKQVSDIIIMEFALHWIPNLCRLHTRTKKTFKSNFYIFFHDFIDFILHFAFLYVKLKLM